MCTLNLPMLCPHNLLILAMPLQLFFKIQTKCLSKTAVAYLSSPAVYNHWTGLVDWTSGLDWWTDTKNHFFTLFNKTYSPVELCGNPVALSLYTQSWNK